MAYSESQQKIPDRKFDDSLEWELHNSMLRRELHAGFERFEHPKEEHNARIQSDENILTIRFGNIVANPKSKEYILTLVNYNSGETSVDFEITETIETVIPVEHVSAPYLLTRSYVVLWDQDGKIIPADSSFELRNTAPINPDCSPVEDVPSIPGIENQKSIGNFWWGTNDEFAQFTILRAGEMLEELALLLKASGLEK